MTILYNGKRILHGNLVKNFRVVLLKSNQIVVLQKKRTTNSSYSLDNNVYFFLEAVESFLHSLIISWKSAIIAPISSNFFNALSAKQNY